MLAVEHVETERDTIVQQIRLNERQRDAARILTVGHRCLRKQAAAEEIPLGNADLGERALGRGVTARDREVAGGLLFEIDVENHPIRRRSRFGGDFDGLEEIEVLEPALGAIDQRAVVGIAFRDIEFAANHIVAGAGVAAYIDALDVDPGTFVDGEGDRDGMRIEIAVAARVHDREGITAPRGLDLHLLDRLLQRLGVVERPDIDARVAAQRIGIERRDAGLEIDRRNPVLLAFLDLEGDQEALFLRIIFRERGHHLHVGKAMLQVIAANQIPVGLDTVRIIDVTAGKKAQQIRFVGLDDVLQPIGRIGIVADELDRLDAGFHAFRDRENEIDAVVRLLDDLGIDADVVAAGVTIDLGDPERVGLHHRTRQRAARLGLHFRRKLLVLDLLVALESNAIDHRIFNHGHHQMTAGLVDLDVLEQAGLDQRLQAVIDGRLIEAPAGAGLEIRADGLDFDTPVALDLDRGDGLGHGCRRQHGDQRGSDRHGEHHKGGEQAPPHSHSNIHAQCALVIPMPNRTPTSRQIPICRHRL